MWQGYAEVFRHEGSKSNATNMVTMLGFEGMWEHTLLTQTILYFGMWGPAFFNNTNSLPVVLADEQKISHFSLKVYRLNSLVHHCFHGTIALNFVGRVLSIAFAEYWCKREMDMALSTVYSFCWMLMQMWNGYGCLGVVIKCSVMTNCESHCGKTFHIYHRRCHYVHYYLSEDNKVDSIPNGTYSCDNYKIVICCHFLHGMTVDTSTKHCGMGMVQYMIICIALVG